MTSSYHEHERCQGLEIRWHVLWWRLYVFLSRKLTNQLLNLKRKGHISENIYNEIRQTASLNLTLP